MYWYTKNFLKTARFEEVCKVEFANIVYYFTSQISFVSSSSSKL